MTRWCALAFVAALGCAAAAGAQQQPPPSRPPGDTVRRSTRDTTKSKKDTFNIAPPDSMMRALLARKGYQATRYQGESVTFVTQNNTLLLNGKPAMVQQEKTVVSGTTITFDDVLKRLTIYGGLPGIPGRVHDPSHGDDIVAYDTIKYDINDRHGTAGRVETSADNGAIWCMSLDRAGFVSDSGTKGTLLGEHVSMTTDCSPVPHYHFEVDRLKRVGKNTLVGSSAKLYIGEVPVLWLPWFWQPEKKGRNSGVLTPQFGFAELVRNTASYRRTVDNVGGYLALNDYSDAEVSMDWRSGARGTSTDPGYVRLKSELRYNWRDRFLNGRLGVTRQAQDDGTTTMTYSFQHSQKFSLRSSLQMNVNYSSNTTILQQTTINPLAVVGNINSQINYQKKFGPFQTSFGAQQTQYLGRDQVDRNLPTISVTTSPVAITPWLSWTPSLTSQTQQSLHMDSPSEFSFLHFLKEDGTSDSTRRDRGTRTSSLTFGTPFKAGKFTISANLRLRDRLNDFPEAKLVIDPVDTASKQTLVYARTYLTELDWDLGMNLPQFSQGKWNLTPSVTLRNVDPGAFIVRSERTGSHFVTQSKRASYGLSVSPTFFARTPGIGPFSAIRHTVQTQIGYSYSPPASVSNEYLAALGRTRAGYLGALAQNRVSFGLTQVFEAKFRADSTAENPTAEPRKIKLLSVTFSPLEYDFELAKATGRLGFASERFDYTVRSDLLPGFDFGVGYSLFDAPVISDTAHFSPYPESVHASLRLGNGAGGFGFLGRLLGWATGERPVVRKDSTANASAQTTQGVMQVPINAGGRTRPALTNLPTAKGWEASINFTSSHLRPPRGSNVIAVDPRASCDVFRVANPIQYDICLRQVPPANTDYSQTFTTGGGPVYSFPATTSIGGNVSFNLSHDWQASWQTNYDVVRHEFASQIVSLQRDLHDWRALFGFQQAPNGNFAFNFLISLKPAPDVQFPYNQRSYRSTGAPR